jgi:hypothetical protein
MSSDEYLQKKLRPIFNSMTESIIRECPQEPVSIILLITIYCRYYT